MAIRFSPRRDGVVIVGDKEYGTGSSRGGATKGTRLLSATSARA